MTDDPTMDPDGAGIVAAEYVLGVLDAAERRAVERRLGRDPALASEIAFWEERLSGLADRVAPVPPPPAAWTRIEAAVGAETTLLPTPLQPLWQSLAFWRGLAGASTAIAVASIAALAYVGLAPPPRAPLMATLGNSAGQPNFVATVTAQGNSLIIMPAALLTNDPRSYELWLIPSGSDSRPRALGMIEPGQPLRLDIPADLAGRITRDATLAVSREPPGGSPTGQPTGPVIASGRLSNL